MCKELDEELARGRDTAKQLITHMEAMGGAGKAMIPVHYITANGQLQEWLITVELKGSVNP